MSYEISFADSFSNEVSNLIHQALSKGMDITEACRLVCIVAADYGRADRGPEIIEELANAMRERCDEPLPEWD